MNKKGPIVVVEDDQDDQEILSKIFQSLKYDNEILFFNNGNEALLFLNDKDVSPFLILSDINMPLINGFELKNRMNINQQLQAKCYPYLFFSTAGNKDQIDKAYGLSVQGFFVKPDCIREWEDTIKAIMDYWTRCVAPNHCD